MLGVLGWGKVGCGGGYMKRLSVLSINYISSFSSIVVKIRIIDFEGVLGGWGLNLGIWQGLSLKGVLACQVSV